MTNNNPYSLVVNAENATCVVEFDVDSAGDINYETWEVFYNKHFTGNLKQTLNPEDWVLVNDLIHDKTWESIEDQIKEQWKDVEEQQRAYDESY
jgi:spermidine synthase